GSGVLWPEQPQHQGRVSKFLGTVQPNGLVERRSLPKLSERGAIHGHTTGHSGSLEGSSECESGNLRSGCLDYQAEVDHHLWSAMELHQRAGFRATCTKWALRQYPGIRRYSLADLENKVAQHGGVLLIVFEDEAISWSVT